MGMGGDMDKFEECKKEIRSTLLPYQNGLHLVRFNRAYREMTGIPLPFKEFGFPSDIVFLQAMPDAVKITCTRTGEYHVQGIADSTTKHIEILVSKQKPPKEKAARPSRQLYRPKKYEGKYESYEIPPRFRKAAPPEKPKLEENEPLPNEPECSYVLLPQTSDNDFYIPPPQSKEPKIEPALPKPAFVQKKTVSFSNLLKHNLNAYIPPLQSKEIKSKPSLPKPKFVQKEPICNSPTVSKICSQDELIALVRHFKDELAIDDVLPEYNRMYKKSLNVSKYGYSSVEDFIKDIPELDITHKNGVFFVKYQVTSNQGSNSDGLAGGLSNTTDLPINDPFLKAVLMDCAILNIRKILEACPEGIKTSNVLQIYNINYRDPLKISDFGFSNLNTFLMNIKHRVPFKFDIINGEKFMYLVKLNDGPADSYNMTPEAYDNEAIPFDAVFPDFVYKPQTLPPDFDFQTFTTAYTSTVQSAGDLFLQFEFEDRQIIEFENLPKDLNAVYNGDFSDRYLVKDIHIKVGGSYIARWSVVLDWHRVRVISIPSLEEVEVFFVDYGTVDKIPKSWLRYAKEQFKNLPAQATKCCLAFIKPPNNAAEWDRQTGKRILDLCSDVRLMAKIIRIQHDGVHSVILCDTTNENDVYIVDLLINEGLAELDITFPNQDISYSGLEQLEQLHDLNPAQLLEAKTYLQTVPTILPALEMNENYKNLLNHLTVLCDYYNSTETHNVDLPPVEPQNTDMPTVEPPVSNEIPSAASVSSADQPSSSEAEAEEEDEIFEDDDEMFQQFLENNMSVIKQYVKRIIIGDVYKIHIIILDSQPYASSGDVSHLIWKNKEADYLLRRLQLQLTETDIPSVSLSENGNEELFQQLYRYNVKGVKRTTGSRSSVLLYSLKVVIKILNMFGHPSINLRSRLIEEIADFNPYDPQWSEQSPDLTETREEDILMDEDDDDDIEMLCLPDLLAMKESIASKRKKINSNCTHEINELNQLYQRVLQRIDEVKTICNFYA